MGESGGAFRLQGLKDSLCRRAVLPMFEAIVFHLVMPAAAVVSGIDFIGAGQARQEKDLN